MYSGTPAEEHSLHCVVSSAIRGENRNQFKKGENLFFFFLSLCCSNRNAEDTHEKQAPLTEIRVTECASGSEDVAPQPCV